MPWLLTIMQNRLADAARRYSRRGAHEVRVEQPGVTFSDRLANTEAKVFGEPEALRKAIRKLPYGQRQAIEMSKLSEMSF